MSGSVAGRRDHDLLRACVEVLLRPLAIGEETRRLEHDVDTEVAPRQRRRDRARRGCCISSPAARSTPSASSTSPWNGPRFESYRSRWAIVFASPRSFSATISRSEPSACCARKKFRPMRPNPLMPTRMPISPPSLDARSRTSLTPLFRELLEGAQAALHRRLRRRRIRSRGELAQRRRRMPQPELRSLAHGGREARRDRLRREGARSRRAAAARSGSCGRGSRGRRSRAGLRAPRVSATTARSSRASTVSDAPMSASSDSIASQLFA